MKIDKVDTNFAVKLNLTRKDIKLYDVCESPFTVHGLITPSATDDLFRRLPSEVASSVSDGVFRLHTHTAGGRVRFKTNSDYIAIIARMPSDKIGRMSHFALTGSAGFDLYTEIDNKQVYLQTYIPPYNMTDGYESEFVPPEPGMMEYTLNFPLYSAVTELKIALSADAEVLPPRKYTIDKPVVYYGSSITQGGCASRPGNSYQSVISRVLDCDYINLGFSGNANGETEMANYIASLEMSAFVYDYDHNAPDEKHLADTHKPMFDIIRNAHPDIPIICVSAPISKRYDDRDERRRIVMSTFEQARANGDKNVYFVNGADFAKYSYSEDSLSVDGCHPNDLGFMCMAQAIGEVLKKTF